LLGQRLGKVLPVSLGTIIFITLTLWFHAA